MLNLSLQALSIQLEKKVFSSVELTKFYLERIKRFNPSLNAFITIDEEKTIQARTVIISTGASAKYLGLEAEKRLAGHGVSACAVCDGFFYKNQEVVIVGGGDTAAEEATYLSKLSPKVTMLVRREELRASKAMQHRVMNSPNIHIEWNRIPTIFIKIPMDSKVCSYTYSYRL